MKKLKKKNGKKEKKQDLKDKGYDKKIFPGVS